MSKVYNDIRNYRPGDRITVGMLREYAGINSLFAKIGDSHAWGFLYNDSYNDIDDAIALEFDSREIIFSRRMRTLEECLDKVRAYSRIWTESNSYFLDGLYATTVLEYDPIANVDADESWTEVRTPDLNYTNNDTRTPNLKRVASDTLTNPDVTVTENVSRETSPFNTSQSQPLDSQNRTTTTDSHVISNSTNETETGTETYESERSETGTETVEHESRRKGNIGITTTQQLIDAEREVVKMNFIREWYKGVIDYVTLHVWSDLYDWEEGGGF